LAEIEKLHLSKTESQLLKPSYTSKEIDRYYANPFNKEWVIYTTSEFKNPAQIKPYPNIKKHLDRFQEVITSDNRPYGLHRAKEERFFKDTKIVVPRKCKIPAFSCVNFDSYVSATFYIIKTDRLDNYFLTGLLNSRLIQYWLKSKGKMQGGNYQLDKGPIMELPLYSPQKNENEICKAVIDFVKQIMKIKLQNKCKDTAETKNFEEEINIMVYKMYNINKDEQLTIDQSI
jgi:hypothetical protein